MECNGNGRYVRWEGVGGEQMKDNCEEMERRMGGDAGKLTQGGRQDKKGSGVQHYEHWEL